MYYAVQHVYQKLKQMEMELINIAMFIQLKKLKIKKNQNYQKILNI
jgi:hypothetical protein